MCGVASAAHDGTHVSHRCREWTPTRSQDSLMREFAQGGQSTARFFLLYEYMIVIVGRHNVGADALRSQRCGDRCGKSDGVQARMNG